MAVVLASLAAFLLAAACVRIGWQHRQWGLLVLGLFVLLVLPHFVLVLGLVAGGTTLAAVYASHVRQTRNPGRQLEAVKKQAAVRSREIAELRTFAQAAAAVQARTTLSAQEKDIVIAEQYQRSRRSLQAAGQLTPQVDSHLHAMYEKAVNTHGAMTAEVTQSLQTLLQTYAPGKIQSLRELLGYWWRKALGRYSSQ